MTTPANDLVESALSLPPTDRADLALRLLQSLTPPGEEVSDLEFSQQLQERVEKYRAGDITSVGLKEARAAIEQSLSRRPSP